MNGAFVYPYQPEIQNLVLDRFLPPYYEGGINTWLTSACLPGAAIWDPFGSHPLLPLDAAAKGFTVFVNSYNPILRLALQVFASSPTPKDFNRALAEFSTIKRGEETLEQHLRSLYHSKCPSCAEITPVTAFIWQKDAPQPSKKIITCTKCHQSGEFALEPYDLNVLQKIGNTKLHRSRALSSVADPQNPLYHEIEAMLDVFPLRSLYTVINMTNRINGGIADEKNQLLLLALLLNFCDYGNALWDPDNKRFRPKQLMIPSVYKEYNPWLFIDSWIAAWCRYPTKIPVTTWPEISEQPGGSICLLPFRLKESISLIKSKPIQAVIGIIPRPSNAFWSLSAFWSGWLYGLPAAKTMAFAFSRKRYDWQWHASALSASFEWINQSIQKESAILLNTPELSPGFVSALFAAGHTADWLPEQAALNTEEGNLYSLWRHKPSTFFQQPIFESQMKVKQALLESIKEINEPVPYLPLHTLYCYEFCEQLPSEDENSYQIIKNGINQIFKTSPLFYRTRGSDKEKQSGHWWIKSSTDFNQRLTLSERLEAFTYLIFQKEGWLEESTYYQQMGTMFAGVFSPSREMLQDCLLAYGNQDSQDIWRLSEMDIPQQRNKDINQIVDRLVKTGEAYQFSVEQTGHQVIWNRKTGQVRFSIINSGICSPFFPDDEPTENCYFLIFPGSKSKLIHKRLEIDPRYQLADIRCTFVKFRHILRILDAKPYDADQFLVLLNQDKPSSEDNLQMSLFSP
jgi:hypothetical protein